MIDETIEVIENQLKIIKNAIHTIDAYVWEYHYQKRKEILEKEKLKGDDKK